MPALLLLCLNLLVFSCKDFSEESSPHAYIGGEIVNPTIDYVVFKHQGKTLDTIRLNDKNKFSYKIEDAKQGLYLIEHKPEIQNIYITPGDSLLLRANTLAFDESLHFSGKGSGKNNFLADMFLLDENNAQFLLDFHKYKPEVFQQKADSIKKERLNKLSQVSEKKNFSEDFKELAKEIIKYENFDLKERYTYLVNRYYKEYSRQFPEDFHDYREEIDFNCSSVQCNPGYKRLLENYLINYSLAWCKESGLDNADCYNLTSVDNIISRLKKAGELVTEPTIKERLMEKIAVRGIVATKNRKDIISILQELKAQDLNEEKLDEMRQLGTIQLAYLPGTSLYNAPLITMTGELINLGEVISKPTVVYLWSIYNENYRDEHKLINNYRKKYPEVDFIGINLDLLEEPAWRVAVRQNGYDPSNQFQLATTTINKHFFTYFLDKMLFLNASSEVVVGDIYLTSPEFESQLLEFLN